MASTGKARVRSFLKLTAYPVSNRFMTIDIGTSPVRSSRWKWFGIAAGLACDFYVPYPIPVIPIFARIITVWTMIFFSYERMQIKVGLYSISRMLNNHHLPPF
jgi:hypothetical protein